ncbi:Sentrin-specific protease 1 [Galdieria sulphuraria]|uniref:SUMO-specific protease/ cysteine-type peptidase n=1 Tax=Galdieria sulphuraria TaxID=130081 RepID=M2XC96_GALSU|nr:SUMO-specific protease/ cysteine-type peptidase [Galdieria sulphuraria]EME27542.1 SUMO-specific protease/ cysteine-type peptidase [Galdieria sulphuraria]GJD09742.1 Sentrin-specific protease 1 [Galdieria sulphuraria]|eukprot:XP_005704062.1 SUMO-specific protease/ cysteine-type peptidase [Galdieria sulphuraria]
MKTLLKSLKSLDFSKTLFTPLDEQEEKWIEIFLQQSSENKVTLLSPGGKLQIPVEELKLLVQDGWITDIVIDGYLSLLIGESDSFFIAGNTTASEIRDVLFRPHIFAFSPFFYTRLCGSGEEFDFAGVRQWTVASKIDVLQRDLLLFPILHSKVHWFLTCLDLRTRKVLFLDPYPGRLPVKEVCSNLLRWLINEVSEKYGETKARDLEPSGWRIVNCFDIPSQRDTNNCGVYLLLFAHHLEQGRVINFTQEDVSNARKRILFSILSSKLYTLPDDFS